MSYYIIVQICGANELVAARGNSFSVVITETLQRSSAKVCVPYSRDLILDLKANVRNVVSSTDGRKDPSMDTT